MAVAQNVMQSI